MRCLPDCLSRHASGYAPHSDHWRSRPVPQIPQRARPGRTRGTGSTLEYSKQCKRRKRSVEVAGSGQRNPELKVLSSGGSASGEHSGLALAASGELGQASVPSELAWVACAKAQIS